jgi:hypothetical protein
MKLELHRSAQSEKGTFGILVLDDEPLCVTCEDDWQDNAAGRSCIPPGIYKCLHHDGEHYKRVWEVLNVPGRTAILIHNGNTARDTQGCILVGDSFGHVGGAPAVMNSLKTLDMLRQRLPDAFMLEIIDCT